jgi:hypothetical protein
MVKLETQEIAKNRTKTQTNPPFKLKKKKKRQACSGLAIPSFYRSTEEQSGPRGGAVDRLTSPDGILVLRTRPLGNPEPFSKAQACILHVEVVFLLPWSVAKPLTEPADQVFGGLAEA